MPVPREQGSTLGNNVVGKKKKRPTPPKPFNKNSSHLRTRWGERGGGGVEKGWESAIFMKRGNAAGFLSGASETLSEKANLAEKSGAEEGGRTETP